MIITERRHVRRWRGRIPCIDRNRNWSKGLISQGLPSIPEAEGKTLNWSSSRTFRESKALVSDSASRIMREYLCFKATQFVVLYYGISGKLTHSPRMLLEGRSNSQLVSRNPAQVTLGAVRKTRGSCLYIKVLAFWEDTYRYWMRPKIF